MCEPPSYVKQNDVYESQYQKPQLINPHHQLANLMNRELESCNIDPIVLRLFIKAYWSRVSALAHAIHESD